MQCPLAPNNLLSLSNGPQKLVTILDIYNAALAPSQFCVGSGLSHAVSGEAGAALENI